MGSSASRRFLAFADLIASGSTWARSSVRFAGSARRACTRASSSISWPTRSSRSSASSAAGSGVLPGILLFGAGYLELIAQAQGHFVEQRGQSGAVRLAIPKLVDALIEDIGHLIVAGADLVRKIPC